MRSDKEFKERYGDDPDEIVAKHITTSSDEEKYLVKAEVREVKVQSRGPNESYHHVALVVDMFHGLFNDKFNPERDIKPEDLTVLVEVRDNRFRRECQAAVENSNGFFVRLDPDPVEDDLTRMVPKVVVVDDTEEEGDE